MRVEPIRDKAVINRIAEALKNDQTEAGKRRYLLYLSGLYLGRRISDLLLLKVGDVYGKDKFVIREKKTGKQIELFITKNLKRAYKERLAGARPMNMCLRLIDLIESQSSKSPLTDARHTATFRKSKKSAISLLTIILGRTPCARLSAITTIRERTT